MIAVETIRNPKKKLCTKIHLDGCRYWYSFFVHCLNGICVLPAGTTGDADEPFASVFRHQHSAILFDVNGQWGI